jgi:TonB family protein
VEILGLFSDRRPEEDLRPEPQSGWRRFLAASSTSKLDGRKFRPEPRRPKRKYHRFVLGTALFILVLGLAKIVAKEMPPLLALVEESFTLPTEQIQALLTQLHIDENENKHPLNPPETHPRNPHHVSRELEKDTPRAVLPPYNGTVRAQLTLTPRYSYHPFQIELKDAHTRKKMELGEPRPLTVDIDDSEPATMRIESGTEPAPAPAAFSVNVDLSGPEADRIANVLEPADGGAGGYRAARKRQDETSVGLAAVVDKNGAVTSVRRVSGSAGLAQAAIDTVRRTRYKPFLDNDHPVEMQTMITVEFTIPQN